MRMGNRAGFRTPPGIPHQDSTVRSHRPCRHFPLRVPQDLFNKSDRLNCYSRLRPPSPSASLVQPHTAPPATRAAPVHDKTLGLSPIPPAISERLCPPFPPTILIAALVISTRETAPKHSARPLATRRHFTTSQPPLWSSEMPPLSSAQKALVAQFVAATGANEKTAQRVRQRCLRYHVMSCVPCAIQSCSILSPCYTTLREEPLCSGIAPSQLSSPHLTCTSDYWRRAVIPFLSAGLSTHRRPLRYLFSLGL